MRFDVITLFPQMFSAITEYGITSRALRLGLYSLVTWNPHDFARGARHNVDDRPYGGGPGMVMMPEPLVATLKATKRKAQLTLGVSPQVVYLSPQGKTFNQACVENFLRLPGLVVLCGRYEAVDQRVIDKHVDVEISLGDFVLSGGELAALCLIDALVRQLPKAVGHPQAVVEESFVKDVFDCPHYTRPEVFEGEAVPKVLLEGNHAHITKWRRQQALRNTASKRPDLITRARGHQLLSAEDEVFLVDLLRDR